MFYLIIFIILVFCSFLETCSIPVLYKMILFTLSLFLLFFVAGLRYETGGDWTSYTVFFTQVEPIELVLRNEAPIYNESYMEPGYKIINSITKSFGGNIQMVFLIIAGINSMLLFKSLKKYTTYPTCSVLIYFTSMFFFLDMVAIRQAVAVLVFFNALFFIYERQFWRFLLLMIIASFFHRSSILLIPLYFIIHKTFRSRTYIIAFVISLLFFFLQIHWMAGLLTVAADIIGGTNGAIIKMYLNSTTYGANRLLSVGALINIVLFIIYVTKRSKFEDSKYFNIYFNLFMMNVIVFFVFYEFMEISNRYRYYFLLSNLILLPWLITIYRDVLLKISIFIFICGFSFLYGRSFFFEASDAIAFNPYQNYLIHVIFNTESDGEERLRKSDEQYIESRKRK